jgi:MOSC domain-containing protein YiiM
MPVIGSVRAVALDNGHHFSKYPQHSIKLVENHGVEGDAHAGPFVRHRYLARRRPRLANLRQVHLVCEEMLFDLQDEGFPIGPGELGENILTNGIALEHLPLSMLTVGSHAVIELTGLRTPCVLIDRFRPGLKSKLVLPGRSGVPFRAGVLGIVRTSGDVAAGNRIVATIPPAKARRLPPL